MAIQIPRFSSADKKKAIALAGLFGLLAIMVFWNVIPARKATPAKPPTPPNDGRVKNSDLATKKGGGAKSEGGAAEAVVFGPIAVLPPIVQVADGALGAVRNVFAYPPPPPPKVIPQPPIVKPAPPTINLGSINPSTVFAGTPRPLTLTLMGSLIPRDARAFIDDRPANAQRVSENVVKVTISASDLASPRAISIQLKSASQPQHLWSQQLKLQVVPSPDPSEMLVYSGRVGNQAVLTFKDDRRPVLAAVGAVINGQVPWKVVTVSDKQVELLDTRNDIRKILPLAPKGAK